MGKVAKPCRHCGAPNDKGGNAVYCSTCIPRGSNAEGMKWRALIYNYGVDKFMWDAMYFEQDGTCLICKEREAKVVDHCHKTGRVRGLLCLGCNTLLGFIETEGRLDAALDYAAEGIY